MALARCILGKFLRVGCHCFPPPLDVLTFAARCLHVATTREILAAKGELLARMVFDNFAEMMTSTPFRDILQTANLRHVTDGYTSPPKENVLRIFSAGFEPANLGTKGQHATPRSPGYLRIYRISSLGRLGKVVHPA
jgi:hypothetical protein